ncbi:response regulator [Brevibacillus sp. SYP-B805]|uniref:response regulator n=1 Tax=Brevibacillus sp. SYP-B805 TaxID=1578199 RepID=UPI0013ED91CA|nr:response regulator [Brevibacillus sp. SYP-B805]NGQ95418.1 response regulator [Brevibacillus sp. SYP-B805]
MDIQRNVLIVDDSKNLRRDIQQYESIFRQLKLARGLDYNLSFESTPKYEEAIALISSSKHVYDVLLIDYDLSTAGNEKDGIELVREIRKGINKHCKIIFYTMGFLDDLFPDRKDMVRFFNCGVYKFLPKELETDSFDTFGSRTHQLRVEAIIEAIKDIDYVQVSLERYFVEYSDLISDEKIIVDGSEYTIEEIINHIRNDDIIGEIYKSNLARSLILHNIAFRGK